jgi:hypothetical protein
MWFNPGLAGLFITSTLLHLKEDINSLGRVTYFITNELDSYIPSICVSLLQEFEDEFPNEISSGLPPIQGIEYHINVVLGLAIPNRPAYRSNLKERKEFQRQVGELILKGYI